MTGTEIIWGAVVIVFGWVFQAGINYAWLLSLRGQQAASITWQNSHSKENDRKFLLVVGMLGAMVEGSQRDKFLELIKEFSREGPS